MNSVPVAERSYASWKKFTLWVYVATLGRFPAVPLAYVFPVPKARDHVPGRGAVQFRPRPCFPLQCVVARGRGPSVCGPPNPNDAVAFQTSRTSATRSLVTRPTPGTRRTSSSRASSRSSSPSGPCSSSSNLAPRCGARGCMRALPPLRSRKAGFVR